MIAASTANETFRLHARQMAEIGCVLRDIQTHVTSTAKVSLAAMISIHDYTKATSDAIRPIPFPQHYRAVAEAQAAFADTIYSIAVAGSQTRLLSNEILGSVQSVIAARDALASHLGSVVGVGNHIRHQLCPNLTVLAGMKARLDALKVTELAPVASDMAATDAVFEDLGREPSLQEAAEQLQSQLIVTPHFFDWTIEHKLNFLIDWTAQQDNAKVRIFMVNLLCNLLASLIWWSALAAMTTTLHHGTSSNSKVVREVYRIIGSSQEAISPSKYLRVVRRDTHVRRSCRSKTAVVATIEAGSVVHLAQKNKKWSQIDWMDSNTGEFRHGWIRSKYLLRLNR